MKEKSTERKCKGQMNECSEEQQPQELDFSLIFISEQENENH